ncbi:MAG TPA: enoyl-CoA hydratase-related protein [Dermatophilaceae bacterium]|nr:enoyl-CoA hydratase-related protein [Dermatophilaceae bacterium]
MTAEVSAAETAPVLVEVADGIATVRLNRPEGMNSLDTPTKDALLGALRRVADDPAARCVVLTGSGRAFCVGQDLKEHIGLVKADRWSLKRAVHEHYNPIVTLIATMNKPVIAAVNGVAAGAGASFAFAADLRVMVEGGGVNLAFTAIALSCDSGMSWSLPRLVGVAKAKELLFFPRTVKAAECLELGLVHRVVPAEDLDATVAELAGSLAAGPTLSYGALRQAIAFSAGHDFVTSLANEEEHMHATGLSDDHMTAVEAFLTKQAPVYEGR